MLDDQRKVEEEMNERIRRDGDHHNKRSREWLNNKKRKEKKFENKERGKPFRKKQVNTGEIERKEIEDLKKAYETVSSTQLPLEFP